MISTNFQIHFLWKHLIRNHRVRDIHIVTFCRTWSSIDRQSSDHWTKTERSGTSWNFDQFVRGQSHRWLAQSKFYQNLLELCQFWGRNGPNFHFCRRYKYDCIQIQKLNSKFKVVHVKMARVWKLYYCTILQKYTIMFKNLDIFTKIGFYQDNLRSEISKIGVKFFRLYEKMD